MQTHPQIKAIGINGQISLGKEFAGKTVMIDQLDTGTWIIKSGQFIPDSEKWLHHEEVEIKLETALDWARNNKPQDNFAKIVKKLEDE